jgi:hypothetical protein
MAQDTFFATRKDYSVNGVLREKSRYRIAAGLVMVILILGGGTLILGGYRGWTAGEIGDLFIKIVTPITALLGMLIGFLTKGD